MTMLGAQLEDLAHLSATLATTSSDIAASRLNATTATSNVVEAVRSSAQQALSAVLGEMDRLRATVAASQSSTAAATWTGVNAQAFRDGYAQFQQSMTAAEQTTSDTFQQFTAAIDQMSQALTDYANQLGIALDSASDATRTMSSAVDMQRANLDQVMNTGLSFG